MKKNLIYINLALLYFASLAVAASESGGYAGAHLKISVEARPAAMGGAYIAISDDAAGQLYNPAGVSAVRQKVFASSYRAMGLDRSIGFISFLLPTKKESALGLSWQFVGSGSVDVRNTSGVNMGTSISSNEHIFSLTFAKQFSPFVGLGTKLNYYMKGGSSAADEHRSLYDINATSIGINLGTLFYIDSLFEYGSMEGQLFTDIKLGLAFNNLAARYIWGASEVSDLLAAPEDKFPIIYGGGLSFRTLQRKLLMAVDLEKVEKRPIIAKFGGEFSYNDQFALRAGLNDGVITAGLGYQFKAGIKNILIFNYAFSGERVGEGNDHLFGFHFKF
jgi:hypothetical protein